MIEEAASRTVRLDEVEIDKATTMSIEDVHRNMRELLPTLDNNLETPVNPLGGGISSLLDEEMSASFLAEEDSRLKREVLLERIEALLDLNERAKKNKKSLADEARSHAELCRQTLEQAWVSLLEKNSLKEESVRWIATFFSNMLDARHVYKNKVHMINATAAEIASDVGRKMIAQEMSNYVNRPDSRQSRAYLIVQGWVGGTTALSRLAKTVHDHRALLITDAPKFENKNQLEDASKEGGVLEELAGTDVYHRHTILLGNSGRAREPFIGEYAEEKKGAYIPLSAPWFGSYLGRIVNNKPWKPIAGYHPIAGVNDVTLDLVLSDVEGHSLYLKHRINPAILLGPSSTNVGIWGVDTLSKVDNGIQIGVAVVENLVIRYAEWIVNRYGMYVELDEATEIVGKKLSRFINDNAGADRMFRSGSDVKVTTDERTKKLIVEFELYFRQVAEQAFIRISKSKKRPSDQSKVEISGEKAA